MSYTKLLKHPYLYRAALLALALVSSAATVAGADLVVTRAATLWKAPNAPLARVLKVKTNKRSRVSVAVESTNGRFSWERHFQGYSRNHRLPIVGFEPGTRYRAVVTVHDVAGESLELAPFEFWSGQLPADFPPIELRERRAWKMEPGYTLFVVRDRNPGGQRYTVIVNDRGKVIWYTPQGSGDSRQLENGNILYLAGANAIEIDLFGDVVRRWHATEEGPGDPGDILVNTARMHHEIFPTEENTFITLISRDVVVDDFPTSVDDPNAPTETATVIDDPVVEFALDGTVLNEWSIIDMLDARRISYSSLNRNDWAHANAVIHDPVDNSILVSLRHQDAVIKFSRDTGELIWILGTHENWKPEFEPYLLTPVGSPFRWQFHQHAPQVLPNRNVLLFDNGNFRATPFNGTPAEDQNNFSRAVEYEIDEENMTIRQVWEYGENTVERLFARFICDADWMPQTGNVLATFGGLGYIDGAPTNGVAVRIIEVDRRDPANKVFELAIESSDPSSAGYSVYRSERIADLYPAPVSVRLASDTPSPAELASVGTVTHTAHAEGGSGQFEYEFWLKAPGQPWQIMQAYGPTDSLAWMPNALGTWRVRVRMRNLDSSAAFETEAKRSFIVVDVPPVATLGLTSSAVSPVTLPSAPIGFLATADGGTGSYEYDFWVRDPMGNWTEMQSYSTDPTFDWAPTTPGEWAVQARARNVGSPAAWEARRSLTLEFVE